MQNYFEFFGLKEAFFIHEQDLFKRFIEYSKEFHPDHSAEEDLAEALEKTSLNNKAYSILKKFNSRLQYMLELKGLSSPENKDQLSPEFLMEMMELNMELEDAEGEEKKSIILAIEELRTNVLSSIKQNAKLWDENNSVELLELIYKNFLELKYFNRLLKE